MFFLRRTASNQLVVVNFTIPTPPGEARMKFTPSPAIAFAHKKPLDVLRDAL